MFRVTLSEFIWELSRSCLFTLWSSSIEQDTRLLSIILLWDTPRCSFNNVVFAEMLVVSPVLMNLGFFTMENLYFSASLLMS